MPEPFGQQGPDGQGSAVRHLSLPAGRRRHCHRSGGHRRGPGDGGDRDPVDAGGQGEGVVPGRCAGGALQRQDRAEGRSHPAERAGGYRGEPLLLCHERAKQHRPAAHQQAAHHGRRGRAGRKRKARPHHPAALHREKPCPERTGAGAAEDTGRAADTASATSTPRSISPS